MVIAVRTERGPNGLEVVKVADDDAGRARLAHEAEMLGRCAHPGVVEVVGVSESTLRLRHRGTPLSRLGVVAPDHAAAIVRALADVVDAIHQQGIAHHRISTDHIVLNERGRPHLCGFAEASEADHADRSADVADLGRVLDEMLDAGSDALWSERHRGVRAATRRRRAMAAFRTTAESARRSDPAQRPTARQFATALGEALPGLALPTPPGASADARSEDFGEIPSDIDPTADLGWSDLDLSFLGIEDDVDDDEDTADGRKRDPYAALAALSALDPEELDLLAAADAAHAAAPTADEDEDEDDEDEDDEVEDTDEEPADEHLADEHLADEDPADEDPAIAGETHEGATPDDEDVATGADEPHAASPLPPTVEIRPPSEGEPLAEGDAETGDAGGPGRGLLVLVAAILLILGVVAGAAIARAIDPFDTDSASASPEASTTTTTTTDAEPAPATPPTQPPECPAGARLGPDADGDGCLDELVLDGRTATVGSVEVELGEEGDLVTLADPDCDGIATPDVLRPDTGEVFTFAEWSLDESVEVPSILVIDGAESIATGPEPCSPAVVTDRDGAEHVVPTP